MLYLSKGIVSKQNQGGVTISHCGALHRLTGHEAALWLGGQRQPGRIQTKDPALERLMDLGIAEVNDGAGMTALFRLLTGCVICPRGSAPILPLTNYAERRVWRWITKAGLRLTMAELVFLSEKDISPAPGLLGAANRQALTEAIYSPETIRDGTLESMSENSPARDAVVEAVLGLLRRRKIFLI